jgi:hypothetical protein
LNHVSIRYGAGSQHRNGAIHERKLIGKARAVGHGEHPGSIGADPIDLELV